MRIKNYVLYTFSLLAILIIILAGALGRIFIEYASDQLPDYSEHQKRQYTATGKPSYLLQSLVTRPTKNNTFEILLVLLDEGDYQLAERLNFFLKVDSFQILAADAALLNGDIVKARNYKNNTKESPTVEEFNNFILAAEGKKFEQILAPQTESGKLLKMVGVNDFSLYALRDTLGRDLGYTVGNARTLSGLLHRAELLAQNGHPHLALLLLNTKDNECSKEYYIIKSNIERVAGSDQQLDTIEEGLGCRPDDPDFLEKAVLYSNESADHSKAKFYQERLKYLSDLSLH